MKKSLFYCLILMIFSLSITSCKKDNDKKVSEIEGWQYYQNKEYEKAIPLLEKSAQSGNAKASYLLGEIYRNGEGVKVDVKKACQRYLDSSERNYKDAYLETAICFYFGEGLEKNHSEALKWGKKIADEMDDSSLDVNKKIRLAILMQNLYYKGSGTLQDFSEAAKWARKGAELGDAHSQGLLAFFLFSGKGILQNKSDAKIWAEKSARQNNPFGQNALGFLYEYPAYGEKENMTEAINWYEKASEKGVYSSTFMLAKIYEEGKGVDKDIKKSLLYYKLAEKQGSKDAEKKVIELEKTSLAE